jgi:hypothetical protein
MIFHRILRKKPKIMNNTPKVIRFEISKITPIRTSRRPRTVKYIGGAFSNLSLAKNKVPNGILFHLKIYSNFFLLIHDFMLKQNELNLRYVQSIFNTIWKIVLFILSLNPIIDLFWSVWKALLK